MKNGNGMSFRTGFCLFAEALQRRRSTIQSRSDTLVEYFRAPIINTFVLFARNFSVFQDHIFESALVWFGVSGVLSAHTVKTWISGDFGPLLWHATCLSNDDELDEWYWHFCIVETDLMTRREGLLHSLRSRTMGLVWLCVSHNEPPLISFLFIIHFSRPDIGM